MSDSWAVSSGDSFVLIDRGTNEEWVVVDRATSSERRVRPSEFALIEVGDAPQARMTVAEVDEDEWIPEVEVVYVVKGTRTGSEGVPKVRVELPSGESAEIPASRWGIEGRRNVDTLVNDTQLVVAEGARAETAEWLRDPNIVLAEKNNKLAEKERVAKEEAARENLKKLDRFINPYTFVPLPTSVEGDNCLCPRSVPAGHHRLADRHYSGSLVVRATTLSPLLLRDLAGGVPTLGGSIAIPGSTLKGVLRGVHESIAGGCMRVLDVDYVPVHRDPVRIKQGDWRIVQRTDEQNEFTVRVSDRKPLLVALNQLEGPGGRPVTTGDRFDLPEGSATYEDCGRQKLSAKKKPVFNSNGEWIVLITDAKARKRKYPYWAALGHLPSTESKLISVKVGEEVLDTYARRVDGSRDMQDKRAGRTPDTEVEFEYRPEPKSDDKPWTARAVRRAATSRHPKPGDVLWARVEYGGGKILELARARVWRSEGYGVVRDRVDKQLHPCSSNSLCVSCRVFGAADDEGGTQADGAAQYSYRGHVRIGWARPVHEPIINEGENEGVRLAPMGQPRPSAGQFYLRHEASGLEASGRSDRDRPLKDWGALPDRSSAGPRPIRGRKFYWHAYQADKEKYQRHRFIEGAHRSESKMGGNADLIAPGAQFEFRVTFEGLTSEEVGSLIATLEPQRVLEGHLPPSLVTSEKTFAHKVGGGKPLGLGTTDLRIVSAELWRGAGRYLGEAPMGPDTLGGHIDDFVHAVPERVRGIWPHLAAVLHVNHVDVLRVAYPPGAAWEEDKEKDKEKDKDGPPRGAGREEFFESFRFFASTDGAAVSDAAGRRMEPLADPADLDQTLPIRTKGRRDADVPRH